LVRGPSLSAALVREFIHPAVRALPFGLRDRSSPKGPYKELYAGVKQAIFVPIVAGEERIGIVSLRSFGVIRDPNQAMRLGQLLALVVSLYELLAMLMSAQSRMYQELEHQLRTPVFQVRKRAVALLSGIGKQVWCVTRAKCCSSR
jgi:hypothetical protein